MIKEKIRKNEKLKQKMRDYLDKTEKTKAEYEGGAGGPRKESKERQNQKKEVAPNEIEIAAEKMKERERHEERGRDEWVDEGIYETTDKSEH